MKGKTLKSECEYLSFLQKEVMHFSLGHLNVHISYEILYFLCIWKKTKTIKQNLYSHSTNEEL